MPAGLSKISVEYETSWEGADKIEDELLDTEDDPFVEVVAKLYELTGEYTRIIGYTITHLG